MPATIRNYLSWRRMAYNVILNAARSNFARYFSQNFSSLGRTVFGKDSYMNYFQGALTPDKIVYIDRVKNLSVWPNANCSGTTQALTLIALYIRLKAFTS